MIEEMKEGRQRGYLSSNALEGLNLKEGENGLLVKNHKVDAS